MGAHSSPISSKTRVRFSSTNMFTHAMHSRKTLNTLFHHAPLSTTTSSTIFHHAPLSSAISSSRSSYHTTSLTPGFMTSSIHSSLPASTSQLDCLNSPTCLAPTSSASAISDPPSQSEFEISDPSVALTATVWTLLGMLMVVAVTIWLEEIQDRKKPQKLEHGTGERIMGQTENNLELIGLGIMMQPAIEEKVKVGRYERWMAWFANIMEIWTSFAVSRSRAKLGTNAEEGLLLSVQESERMGSEKDRIDIELDPVLER